MVGSTTDSTTSACEDDDPDAGYPHGSVRQGHVVQQRLEEAGGFAAGGGAVVKAQHQELLSDEIAKHLEAGKQVTRLALNLDDHLSFVLGEDLVVRKLKFLEGAVDQLESTERDDLRAELDARFALLAGEARRLFLVLESALKLSKAEA